jgi:hypothetical protein
MNLINTVGVKHFGFEMKTTNKNIAIVTQMLSILRLGKIL